MARRRRRKHPWNYHRHFKRVHRGGGRSGYHYKSNPHKRRRHRRAHRRHGGYRRHSNPDLKLLWKIGLGAVVGIAGSVAAAMALDAVWTTGTTQQKTWALVGLAGVAAITLGASNPVLAAGLATGLVLIPGQQLIAGFLNPAPAPAATGMLHQSGQLGMLHQGSGLRGISDGADTVQEALDDAFLRARGFEID